VKQAFTDGRGGAGGWRKPKCPADGGRVAAENLAILAEEKVRFAAPSGAENDVDGVSH
jgi:hypothetical protein